MIQDHQSHVGIARADSPKPEIWYPAFLYADALNEIWPLQALTAEIQCWHGEPRSVWFEHAPFADTGMRLLQLGKCNISEQPGLSFDGGRHRTRWMLDQGISEIPVYLRSGSYYWGLRHQLISRRGFVGETIPGLQFTDVVFIKR